MSQDINPVDIEHAIPLREMQKYLRSPDRDRIELIEELVVLARVLEMHKDENPLSGIAQGALGGALFCVKALLEDHRHGKGTLTAQQLMNRYAEMELLSFPVTAEDCDKTEQAFRNDNLFVRKGTYQTQDGVYRNFYVSHIRQTTLNGKPIEADELLHPVTRFPPPWRAYGAAQEK